MWMDGASERRRHVASQTEGAKGKAMACGVAKGGVEARRRHVASQTKSTKGKATGCHVANRGHDGKGNGMTCRKPRARRERQRRVSSQKKDVSASVEAAGEDKPRVTSTCHRCYEKGWRRDDGLSRRKPRGHEEKGDSMSHRKPRVQRGDGVCRRKRRGGGDVTACKEGAKGKVTRTARGVAKGGVEAGRRHG
jgi:hypothetical protein